VALNKKEKELILSVKNKIVKYNIPVSLKEAFGYASNIFTQTIYNDKTTELVDSGVELFLIRSSFAYFLDNYCLVDIPGSGTFPMEPYYFQIEMAKELEKYRKIVVDKTRQCLRSTSYVRIKGKGLISIRDVNAGDMIETLIDGMPTYVPVENFYNQGVKEFMGILVNSGQSIECTPDHKILTKEGWKEAQDLTLNDEVLSENGYKKVSVIERNRETDIVYDITTATGDFLANGLMVHNCGISTIFSLYSLWRANFFPSENIDVISLRQQKAQQFINKMKSTLNNLPEWMKTPIKVNNQQQISFAHSNGSVSNIVSEPQSDNAGRSDSLSLLIMDELAFYQSDRMVREIVSAATPTLTKTGGKAIYISCVVGDTYINTENGLQQIVDYKPKKCSLGFNFISSFKIDGINHQQATNTFYDSGITPTRKITFGSGVKNEISEIHPFYVVDKTSFFPYWKQTKDIEVGDYALASLREKTFGKDDDVDISPIKNCKYQIKNWNGNIDEEMAYFFGLLIGDGYIDKKGQYCVITSVDEEVQNFLLNNSHFDCKMENRKDDNIHFRLQGKYLIDLLEKIGFEFGKKAKEKTIPKKLLRMSRNNISALLRGLFDSDGYSRTRDGSIGFTSTSKELIKQVRALLDMFGIQISDERWNIISPEKSTRVNVESFVGQITLSRYFSKVFYEKIGFSINRKQEKYHLVKNLKHPNNQLYPMMNIWVANMLFKKNNVWNNTVSRIVRITEKKHLSRNHIKECLDIAKKENLEETEEFKKLKDFYDKDWFLLKVKNIEVSEAHTYDFVIPETRSFYINGVIGSNTPNGTVGAGSYYYGQVQDAKQELNQDTKYLEIDWWEVPDDPRIGGPKKGYNHILQEAIKRNYYHNRKIKAEYKKFFEPIALNHDANPWLKATFADLKDIKFKQEILHEFVIDGDRVFSEDLMKKIRINLKDPTYKDELWIDGKKVREQRGLWIWRLPEIGHRYILGCLPAGEKVLTAEGLKDIETVEQNDILFDKDGNETRIVNKQIYENVNEPLYKIKIEGILRETSFTGEHPIMSSIDTKISRKGDSKKYRPRKWKFDFKYNKVSELNSGDWLIYPNIYRGKDLDKDSILNEWRKFSSGRYDFNLDENIVLDKDFWWFLGIWLAEGWIQERGDSKSIHTCHNFSKEYNYAEKIRELFKKYGRSVSFIEKPDSNIVETVFNSSQLFAFIKKNFGKYARNKNIPEWIKYAPEEFKKELITGYLNGDGSIFTDKRRENYTTSFVSKSQKLLEDVQDILFSIGFVSSLNVLREEGETLLKGKKEKNKTQKAYQLTMHHHESINFMKMLGIDYDVSKESKVRKSIGHNFISDDLKHIYLRVSSIEKSDFSGTVYNFETENHSYLCNYLTTHNCDVASGTSSDTSAIQILDLETYEQVAEFKGYISTPMFAKLVKDVARAYNDGFVVIESNSIGDTIFSNVYYSENDPYGNVFKQKKTKNGVTRYTGWLTDVKTRKLMTSEFIDWISVPELAEKFKINSERLYAEMETWIWATGDKAIHADNCLTGDTIITCKEGFKKIKDIHIGDLVLTENGEFKPVEETFVLNSDRKVIKNIKASGLPNLKITDSQKVLTFKDNAYQFNRVYELNKSNFVYSIFSNEITNKDSLPIIEIEKKIRNGSFIPTEKQLYAYPILQLELVRHMIRKGKFRKCRHYYSLKTRNYHSLYFMAHILYRNKVAFSMDNNRITIPFEEVFRISPELSKKIQKYKNPRKFFGDKLSSKIKEIKEYSKEETLYDLNVEGVHSFVANGYIVHNCHDDAIMAMSLCLYLRDKAQIQSSAMFLSEDGSVITYDRDEMIRSAKAENESFSSIDGTGKKKLSIKGSNPAGIVSTTEDFGTSSIERELKKEYNINSLDELTWLLGR
jgi:intein/homing endonuclease